MKHTFSPCHVDCIGSDCFAEPVGPTEKMLSVWRASLRMVLVTAVCVAAASLIVTGMTGCADMSASVLKAAPRDAAALGLQTQAL